MAKRGKVWENEKLKLWKCELLWLAVRKSCLPGTQEIATSSQISAKFSKFDDLHLRIK